MINRNDIHQDIQQKIADLSRLHEQLQSSSQTPSALEQDLLKKQCQELYELVLKLDTAVSTEPTTTPPPIEETPAPAFEERTTPELEEAPISEEEPTPEPQPEVILEAVEEPAVEPSEPIMELQEEEDHSTEEEPAIAAPTPDQQPSDELTLNDRISQNQEKKDLVDQMQMTPIDDLKTAITLNKKIAFINELFEEDADTYRQTIESLNQLPGITEAAEEFNSLADKYQWDPEHKLVQEFHSILTRRYS